MRFNEEALLGAFFVALIGIALFSVYFGNPSSPENSVQVKIVATFATQDGPGNVFLPQNFSVKEGQHVTLVFVNQDDSPHRLTIPALNVDTGIVSGGQTAKVSFVPSQTGKFPFGEPTGICRLEAQGAVCTNLVAFGNVTALAP